jgi:hypothetical protein
MESAETTFRHLARRPFRRWLRFSLRTLLILITLLGIWIGVKVNQARRQKEAVEKLLTLGAEIAYDHQWMGTWYDSTMELNVPMWAQQLCGKDFFQNVAFVYFQPKRGPGPAITDDDLVHLAAFPKLKSLIVDRLVTDVGLAHIPRPDRLVHFNASSTSLSDEFLKRLSGSRRLEQLWLDGTLVTDRGLSRLGPLPLLRTLALDATKITDDGLAILEPMPSLESLSIGSTSITDAGLAHVTRYRSLTHLGLERMAITDAGLVHLQDLPKLNLVFLKGTQVTDKGIAALTKALPKLQIASAPEKKR